MQDECGHRDDSESHNNERAKMLLLRAIVQRGREKKTENVIHLSHRKQFIVRFTEDIRNYDQKLSGKLETGACSLVVDRAERMRA